MILALVIYRGHGSGNGPNINGSGGCGFHFDIITGDGSDLVLNSAGTGLKQWTRAGLWPRLSEINKISESRVGWFRYFNKYNKT